MIFQTILSYRVQNPTLVLYNENYSSSPAVSADEVGISLDGQRY